MKFTIVVILLSNILVVGLAVKTFCIERKLENIDSYDNVSLLGIVISKEKSSSLFFRRRIKIEYVINGEKYSVSKRLSKFDWKRTNHLDCLKLICLKSNYRQFKVVGYDSYSYQFANMFLWLSLLLPLLSVIYIYKIR